MTPVRELITRLIREHGPLDIGRFTALALYHPEHGYYMRADPLGGAGDFVTAPEMTQAFGELLGLAFAQHWIDTNRPPAVDLVELGPGRGTLMADFLRAAATVPGFRDALRVHLVETSPHLRSLQERLLGSDAVWHDDLGTVPDDAPIYCVANEFFDALPVRQLVKQSDGWHERKVALTETDALAFVLDQAPSPLAPAPGDAPEGAVTEIAPARAGIAVEIGRRIARSGGLAFVIDYGAGADGVTGDTLQALRHHRPVPVLDHVGEADLTSHVDFSALRDAAVHAGAGTHGPIPLGHFLGALGIGERTEMLVRGASPAQAQSLVAALHKLTSPTAMGMLHKVLAIVPRGAPPPAGFAPEPSA